MRIFIVGCMGLFLVACTSVSPVRDNLIKEANIDIQSFSLGMSKSEALPIIQKWQRQFVNLRGYLHKASEQFIKDGKRIQIFYVMTSRIPDGDITPDEFTPIVFEDDKLAAVGWTALGGAPEVFKADIKVRD